MYSEVEPVGNVQTRKEKEDTNFKSQKVQTNIPCNVVLRKQQKKRKRNIIPNNRNGEENLQHHKRKVIVREHVFYINKKRKLYSNANTS